MPKICAGRFSYVIKVRNRRIFLGVYSPESRENKYKLSIATLFKYKTEYLSEWIDHHLKVGVEHFYLYENNKNFDIKVSEILRPYIQKGVVTHLLWPYPYVMYNHRLKKVWLNDSYLYTQVPQINHSIYKYNSETEWLLSCDTDEFFYSPKYKNIANVINKLDIDNDVSSVKVDGFWFGANEYELEKMKKNGVIKTFIHTTKKSNTNSKCIFNTYKTIFADVHHLILGEGKEIVVSSDILRFNHYWGLSWRKRTDEENNTREIENTQILDVDNNY